MKKLKLSVLSILALLLFMSSTAFSQQVASAKTVQKLEKSSPELVWNKSKHVFGSIEHKHAVTAEFTFTNTSKEAVVITKVGTTCGCTAPIYPKEPVKPGEKGVVKLRFDAMAPGFFQKAAKVHFSDGSAQELEIEGKVQVRMSDVKK